MCCSSTRDLRLRRGKATGELLGAHNRKQHIEVVMCCST
jgi:hypothetical protein